MVRPNHTLEDALPPEELRELFLYDPRTGILTWRRTGKVAGYPEDSGYLRVKIGGRKGRRFMVHRVIWALVTGAWPVQLLDHKDLNRANNRWRNLRPATYGENAQNNHATGVYWQKRSKRFVVTVWLNGRHNYGGCFADFDKAKDAHAKLKAELHPFAA